jgi:hypothetical protein
VHSPPRERKGILVAELRMGALNLLIALKISWVVNSMALGMSKCGDPGQSILKIDFNVAHR